MVAVCVRLCVSVSLFCVLTLLCVKTSTRCGTVLPRCSSVAVAISSVDHGERAVNHSPLQHTSPFSPETGQEERNEWMKQIKSAITISTDKCFSTSPVSLSTAEQETSNLLI